MIENADIRGFWLDSVRRRHYRCAGHAPKIIPWNLILEGEPVPAEARCDDCGRPVRSASSSAGDRRSS